MPQRFAPSTLWWDLYWETISLATGQPPFSYILILIACILSIYSFHFAFESDLVSKLFFLPLGQYVHNTTCFWKFLMAAIRMHLKTQWRLLSEKFASLELKLGFPSYQGRSLPNVLSSISCRGSNCCWSYQPTAWIGKNNGHSDKPKELHKKKKKAVTKVTSSMWCMTEFLVSQILVAEVLPQLKSIGRLC